MVVVDGATIVRGNYCVVSDVALSVKRGQLVALIGPSGCGKTSLLRAIAGLETPKEGSIRVDGRSAEQALHEGVVSIAFQDSALLPWLSCWKNAGWLQLMRSGTFPEQEIRQLAELVELEASALKKKFPAQVSGGERQRVALMRALAVSANLLVLDEPFSALDFNRRRRIIAELRKRLRGTGKTSILVTHDLRDAIHFADRLIGYCTSRLKFDLEYVVTLPEDRSHELRESKAFADEALAVHRWIQD